MKFLRLGLMALLTLGFLGCKPSAPKHGLEFVLTAKSLMGAPLKADELQRLSAALARRADSLGYRMSVGQGADNLIRVKLDPDSKEQIEITKMMISRPGVLEFRLCHPEGEKILAEGFIPGDYQVLTAVSLTPVGKDTRRFLVSRKAVAGFDNRSLKRVGSGRNPINMPEINFELNPEGATNFARLTTENLDRQLAMIIDGQLYSAPWIRTPITGGSGVISGVFTESEVLAFVAILKHPLEARVEIMEERRF
jgi:preprotein translocase subunit SecD